MTMFEQTQQVEKNGWVLRQRIPKEDGNYPIILLFHGWTGNEDSMWSFASKLPNNAILISPRAPFPTQLGGFSWSPQHTGKRSEMTDFEYSAQSILELISPDFYPAANMNKIGIVGFSQGAALTYNLVLQYPEIFRYFSGLSGFLPDNISHFLVGQRLQNTVGFIAHGFKDGIVPVEKARDAARKLQMAGARIFYCEEDVGHKLSAGCYRALRDFFLNEMY